MQQSRHRIESVYQTHRRNKRPTRPLRVNDCEWTTRIARGRKKRETMTAAQAGACAMVPIHREHQPYTPVEDTASLWRALGVVGHHGHNQPT